MVAICGHQAMSVMSHNDDLQEELINEFNKLECKFFVLEAQVQRLDKAVNSVVSMLKTVAKEKGITIETGVIAPKSVGVSDDGSETCILC